jgi:HEAT repeat protein
MPNGKCTGFAWLLACAAGVLFGTRPAAGQVGPAREFAVRRIRLDTAVEYTDRGIAPNISRPLMRLAWTLRAGGLTSPQASAAPPDAVLALRLRGTALAGDYLQHAAPLYTGARWQVVIRLTHRRGNVLYSDSLDCSREPPTALSLRYPPERPSYAPFDDALEDCRAFWWSVVAMVDSIRGRDLAVAAALVGAMDMLPQLGDAAVKAMLRWLDQAEESLRQRDDRLESAVRFFQEVRDVRSVPPLVRFVRDERRTDDRARTIIRAAIEALAFQGGPTAAQAIVSRLRSCGKPEGSLCRDACNALGRLRDRRAVPALLRVAGNASLDRWDRRWAIDALGAIGDSVAIPALSAAALESDSAISNGARLALQLLRGP